MKKEKTKRVEEETRSKEVSDSEEQTEKEASTEQPVQQTAEDTANTENSEKKSDAQYIAELEDKLAKAQKEAETVKNLAQRIQADFDNYRKRNAAIAQEMKELGQSSVIDKMLGVLDNCDLARKYVQDEAALTGFNMMETQILGALTSFGLEEIEAQGKEFDAKLMAAVERVKDEENAGKVVEVLLKGYTLNGKLLRTASVKVAYKE